MDLTFKNRSQKSYKFTPILKVIKVEGEGIGSVAIGTVHTVFLFLISHALNNYFQLLFKIQLLHFFKRGETWANAA